MFRQSSLRRGVCWRHICIESSRWSMSTWSYCATSASLIVSESPRMRREIGHWQQREPTLKWLGPARCAVCLHCAASENQSFVTAAPRPGRRTPTIGMEQDTSTHTSRVSKLLVDAEHIQTRIQSSARVRRYNIDPTCRMHARTRRQTRILAMLTARTGGTASTPSMVCSSFNAVSHLVCTSYAPHCSSSDASTSKCASIACCSCAQTQVTRPAVACGAELQ